MDTATALLADDPRTARGAGRHLADASGRRPPATRTGYQRRHPGAADDRRGRRARAHRAAADRRTPTRTFLVDRAYEQIKLDLDHQDVGRGPGQRRRLLRRRRDGRLHPHVPRRRRPARHPGRLDRARARPPRRGPAAAAGGRRPRRPGLHATVDTGQRPAASAARRCTRCAQGATAWWWPSGRCSTRCSRDRGPGRHRRLHHTPRPFDTAALRALLPPHPATWCWSSRTSPAHRAGWSPRRCRDVPHRLLALGVGRADLHRYGSPKDHARWHGLDAAGLRRSIIPFVTRSG